MTTPNIITAATVRGYNALQEAGTTATAIISNASTSGKLHKVSMLALCNVSSATECAATVAISNGTTSFPLIAGVDIYASLPRTVISRTAPIYLNEGHSITVQAATAGYIKVVASYDEVG